MSDGGSLAQSKGTFLPPAEPEIEEQKIQDDRRLQANLYDAIAGRVNSHTFIPEDPFASGYHDTTTFDPSPIFPEEVLFRQQGMPIRYEETDRYFAHESLPADRPLPSSELLESIHAYAADFYDRATSERGRDDHYSMNGKSLMFMGILLEELAKEYLGETGDLVLVEGEEIPTDEDEPISALGRRIRRKRANSGLSGTQASSGEELNSVAKRLKRSKKKKRRFTRRASTTDVETEEGKKG